MRLRPIVVQAQQSKIPIVEEGNTKAGHRAVLTSLPCAAVVAVLATVTYFPWIQNYLVADSWTVIDAVSRPDLQIADLLPFREAPLSTSATYYYAPVLATLLWFSYKVSGYAPTLYHVIVMSIHIGASLSLFAATLSLTHNRLKATLAGAIFATHFALTEAVGWFGAVSHPTAGFLGALSMALYARYLTTRGTIWWVLALASLLAASLTQSTGLPWFAILALLDIIYSLKKDHRRRLYLRLLALASLLILLAPLQLQAFRFARGGYHYEFGPWVVLNLFYYPLSTVVSSLEASAFSLGRDILLAPLDREALIRLLGMTEAFNLLLGGAIVGLGALLLWSRGGWITRFAILAFAISLTPFLLINGQGYRYLYTPIIFFSLGAANSLVDCARHLATTSRVAAASVIVAAFLFVLLSFGEAQRQMFWWQQAGYVAHQSLHQLKTLQPSLPPGSKVIFGGLPDTLQNSNAQVWRQGIAEAVRVIYNDRSLRVEAYSKGEVERQFREELKGAPSTYGFIYDNWQMHRIAP